MRTKDKVAKGRSKVSPAEARAALDKAAGLVFVPVDAATAKELNRRAKRAKVTIDQYVAVLFDMDSRRRKSA